MFAFHGPCRWALQCSLAAWFVLAVLITPSPAAQNVRTQFITDKSSYLIGEPVYVVLSITNPGDVPFWIDFGRPDQFFCNNFAIEMPGADSALEKWGCGIGGSCGRGLREVLPHSTISIRQLVNRQFRLQGGNYLIRTRGTVIVRAQNLFDSPPLNQFDVSDTLNIEVQPGNEQQLRDAFRPIVEQLEDPDPIRRREAVAAITETAPPFLEDTLIQIAQSSYGSPAFTALRKVGTVKALDALAQIAVGNRSLPFRLDAIRNLGRAGNASYLPTLLEVMRSDDVSIKGAAAQSVGTLDGEQAVQALTPLLSNPDVQVRQMAANAIEYTHARAAVTILIGLLLDPDTNVRQTASSGLALLTHRAVFYDGRWADVTTPQSALVVQQKWVAWWNSQANTAEIHGMDDCAPSVAIN